PSPTLFRSYETRGCVFRHAGSDWRDPDPTRRDKHPPPRRGQTHHRDRVHHTSPAPGVTCTGKSDRQLSSGAVAPAQLARRHLSNVAATGESLVSLVLALHIDL